MDIILQAQSAVPYGEAYVSNKGVLQVGQQEGDYAVLENIDFGEGKRGFKVTHGAVSFGTGLIEVRLDSLKGKVLCIVACASQDRFGNFFTVWQETPKTTGVHNVYIIFHTIGPFSQFEFTTESPYDRKEYIPVSKSANRKVLPDTWEATDMLGRHIPSAEECPDKRDKKVGIFYWSWHEADAGTEPQDLTKILRKYPDADKNYYHEVWKPGSCYWNEPLFGYYRDTDPYVIRKHAAMLAAAGVDFIAFDCTNVSGSKKEAYRAIFEGFRLALADGINVPKITFLMSFNASAATEHMLRSLYMDIYKPGLYSDLWFYHQGKPLIMGDALGISEKGFSKEDTRFLNEIRNFFTFRPPQPSYKHGPRANNEWGWLESAPQHKYVVREDGSCEQMTVGVAQNCNDEKACTYFNNKGTYGRSYTHKDGHALLTDDSYKYGYNFQEQWDNAFEADPDIVFVTGWNEWIMGRCRDGWVEEKDSLQIAFVDQYDYEHSRDIEPDCDGYLDTYYLQLVANIRKFKGTAKPSKASGKKTIDFKLGEAQWQSVKPQFINMKGTTKIRRYAGYGPTIQYRNETGRNDILEARVARDKENIYFYAKCAEKITGTDTQNCMVLYLDLDRNKQTGWEGYEFRICGKELQKSTDNFEWEKVASVKKQIKGDYVQISVPKKLLNLGDSFDIEFKWSDNAFSGNRPEGDIMDFYVNGVCAPIGRFNFRYNV